jgi:hypothetical protein
VADGTKYPPTLARKIHVLQENTSNCEKNRIYKKIYLQSAGIVCFCCPDAQASTESHHPPPEHQQASSDEVCVHLIAALCLHVRHAARTLARCFDEA